MWTINICSYSTSFHFQCIRISVLRYPSYWSYIGITAVVSQKLSPNSWRAQKTLQFLPPLPQLPFLGSFIDTLFHNTYLLKVVYSYWNCLSLLHLTIFNLLGLYPEKLPSSVVFSAWHKKSYQKDNFGSCLCCDANLIQYFGTMVLFLKLHSLYLVLIPIWICVTLYPKSLSKP